MTLMTMSAPTRAFSSEWPGKTLAGRAMPGRKTSLTREERMRSARSGSRTQRRTSANRGARTDERAVPQPPPPMIARVRMSGSPSEAEDIFRAFPDARDVGLVTPEDEDGRSGGRYEHRPFRMENDETGEGIERRAGDRPER